MVSYRDPTETTYVDLFQAEMLEPNFISAERAAEDVMINKLVAALPQLDAWLGKGESIAD